MGEKLYIENILFVKFHVLLCHSSNLVVNTQGLAYGTSVPGGGQGWRIPGSRGQVSGQIRGCVQSLAEQSQCSENVRVGLTHCCLIFGSLLSQGVVSSLTRLGNISRACESHSLLS